VLYADRKALSQNFRKAVWDVPTEQGEDHMVTKSVRRTLLATTIIAGTLAAPAFAQTKPQPAAAEAATTGDEIIVTGTLIQNPNLTSSSPVNVISEGEIALRVPNNAEELIRQIPGVSPGIGSQVNNGSNGTNQVDLRGLGLQRNIVLLDGNRVVPATANGAVDLNIIPVALVSRVDVLTGGASTTYGADAVSGVVNFITKRDFSGVDFRSSYKITEKGDGQSFRADLTVGGNFADDRGNAVLSIGYTKVSPVYQTRPFANFGVNSSTGRASGGSPTSVPTAFGFSDNSFLQLDPTSTRLVPQYESFNFNPYNIFQTPLDRKSVYGSANYEVSDNIEVYARGLFAQNRIKSIIAPSGLFGATLTIPGNNPFLNSTIRNQICTAEGIALGAACDTNPALPLPGVYRRLVELGPRIGDYRTNVYDMRAGVKIGLSDTMSFDLSGSYGSSELDQKNSGYVLNSRVQQALNASSTTACTVTTGGCVPLNLFGPAGSITPAQVAFLNGSSNITIRTDLLQIRGVLNGDLGFTLPSASEPVGFAVGAEYRQYGYERDPDARAQDPSELGGAGGAVLPFAGGYDVKEVYGELIAPLVSDKPFFNELTFELGGRYSSYKVDAANNPKFDAFTYKAGVTWEPVDGVRFRGNYQRAVRAPNIGELFAPVVTGLTSLTADPCAGSTVATIANATGGSIANPAFNAGLAAGQTLRAVCIAQGAPASAIDAPATRLDPTSLTNLATSARGVPNPAAGQANGTGGGDVTLKPEKADTFTFGVVLAPRNIVPNLTIAVDYYKIVVNNALTSPTSGDVIAACFRNLSASSAGSGACAEIRRNTVNGGLSGSTALYKGLNQPTTNLGRLATDGIDLKVNWKQEFGDVGLNLDFNGNYTRSLQLQSISQLSPPKFTVLGFNRDCVGYYSANCGPTLGQIQPKFSFQQRTTVTVGAASLSLLWRYLSSVKYEGQADNFLDRGFTTANRNLFRGTITNQAPAVSALAGEVVDFNRIRAYHYFDLSGQFEIMKTMTLTVGMTNLFNVRPPVIGAATGTTSANSGNTFPSTYDPLGRSFNASVRLKF
jgi:iron complex outermembrane recepter protein